MQDAVRNMLQSATAPIATVGGAVEAIPWWLVAVLVIASLLQRALPALPNWLPRMSDALLYVESSWRERSQRRRLPDARR